MNIITTFFATLCHSKGLCDLDSQNVIVERNQNCVQEFNANWLNYAEYYKSFQDQTKTSGSIICILQISTLDTPLHLKAECRGPNIIIFNLKDIFNGTYTPGILILKCKSNCKLDFSFDGIMPSTHTIMESNCTRWINSTCTAFELSIKILFDPGKLVRSSGNYIFFCKRNPSVHRSLYLLFQANKLPSVIGSGKTIELMLSKSENSVTIPCRSTIWNSVLGLRKIGNNNILEVSTSSNSFEPTIGFSISGDNEYLLGDYECNDYDKRFHTNHSASVIFQVRSSAEIASRVQGEVQVDVNTGLVVCPENVTEWVVTIISTPSVGQNIFHEKCLSEEFKTECGSGRETCSYKVGHCRISFESGLVVCQEYEGSLTSDVKEFVQGIDKKIYTLGNNANIPRGALLNVTMTDVTRNDSSGIIIPGSTIVPGEYKIECISADSVYRTRNISVRIHSNEHDQPVHVQAPETGYESSAGVSHSSFLVTLGPNNKGVSCVGVRRDTLEEETKEFLFEAYDSTWMTNYFVYAVLLYVTINVFLVILTAPALVGLFILFDVDKYQSYAAAATNLSPTVYGYILVSSIALAICLLTLRTIFRLKKRYVQTTKELKEFKYGKPMNPLPIKNVTIDGSKDDEIEMTRMGSSKDYEGESEPGFGTDYDCNPYDTTYEIDDFILHKNELGCGRYGVVMEGVAKGQKVAVKTCRMPVDKMCLDSLKSELKLLIFIENQKDNSDKNILRLVGANTKKLRMGELYIFLEFCELGNLATYLRKFYKTNTTELSDTAMSGQYYLTTTVQKRLSFKTLALWSFQIANGMEYLASKNVIHIDLAARNMLLFDEDTVKISDFGLSRKIVQSIYVKEKSEYLPIQWLAPESLNKNELTFSSKSDVWSYGVTLWEIYSLAVEEPELIGGWDRFRMALMDGERLGRPKYATTDIYSVMLRSWNIDPRLRPSFTELKRFFQNVVDKTPLDCDLTYMDDEITSVE